MDEHNDKQQEEEGKQYIVYKGFCLRPNCFTFDQALRLTGDYKKKKKTYYTQPQEQQEQQRNDDSNHDNNNNSTNNNNSYPPKELKQIFRNEDPKEEDLKAYGEAKKQDPEELPGAKK